MLALKPVVARGSRALADDEMMPFLSRCRVVLGLNEGRNSQGIYQSYLKLRDVEYPGHGCCYLTQHNEDVEHAFEVGQEVLPFRHAAEAASLVRRCVRQKHYGAATTFVIACLPAPSDGRVRVWSALHLVAIRGSEVDRQ